MIESNKLGVNSYIVKPVNFNQMIKDVRHSGVASLIENGQIKKIEDIFQVAAKTDVCCDLHMNFQRFNKAVVNPWNFKIVEFVRLANPFKVDPKKLVDMVYEQSYSVSKHKHKKSPNKEI